MDLNAVLIPGSKRFFKLSELAGKRWPNVTEEDIFTWHDAGEKMECGQWEGAPHYGYINLISFWVFFPAFYSIRSKKAEKPETPKQDFIFDAAAARLMIDRFSKEAGAPFLYDHLVNQYFMLGPKTAHGLAHNSNDKISVFEFYDESGKLHISGVRTDSAFPTPRQLC